MTTFPVFPISRHDYTRDCGSIGRASNVREAEALLTRYFAGSDVAPDSWFTEVADRDVRGQNQLFAYWCEPMTVARRNSENQLKHFRG